MQKLAEKCFFGANYTYTAPYRRKIWGKNLKVIPLLKSKFPGYFKFIIRIKFYPINNTQKES